MTILIPVSAGELVDKLTILEIKMAKISDGASRASIAKEMKLLREIFEAQIQTAPGIEDLMNELRELNGRLWDIEDALRVLERNGDFGAQFIETARNVYFNNDRRFRLKQRINELTQSEITEEKSYSPY